MKKLIHLFLLGIAAMLIGCNSQSTDIVNPGNEKIQIKITVNEGPQSRVDPITPPVDNYVIEVYTDASYNTPANVFEGQTTHKATTTDGLFTAIVDRKLDYYILCWADRKKDDKSLYTTTDLKKVKLTTETGDATEAWFGTGTIAKTTGTVTIPALKRAVAKITLKESGIMLADKNISLSFTQPSAFDIINGVAIEQTAAERVIDITAPAADGTVATVIGTIEYVLASVETRTILEIYVTYDKAALVTFTISNVPIQANHNTNIIGHFSTMYIEPLTITCTEEWETPDVEYLPFNIE